MTVNPEILSYIDSVVLPQYDAFDKGHRRDHGRYVLETALMLGEFYDVNPDMLAVAAACHDLGLSEDRKTHHLVSGKMIRANHDLERWFTPGQIEIIAQAAEDHRASSDHEPRSVYGRLVAEADRQIIPEVVVRRTVQYGFKHYPELGREGHLQRTIEHLHEKYGDGGYLKLWIPESPNAARLEELRTVIRNPEALRSMVERIYDEESSL